MIEDLQLRNLAPATQKNYIAHVAAFARFFGQSPEALDQEAVREYLLYLINERKMSPDGVNQQSSALKFLYLTTLEMPWRDVDFPRVRRPHRPPRPHPPLLPAGHSALRAEPCSPVRPFNPHNRP